MKFKYQVWNDETDELVKEFTSYESARKYLAEFYKGGYNFSPYFIHISKENDYDKERIQKDC